MTDIFNDKNEPNNPDYHFAFSNDNRRLKFTVKNDGFRAVQFHSEPIHSIDLTAGTRRLEEIILSDCLELKNIDWPIETRTRIKRISILNAASLSRLNLIGLSELEELTIVNCPLLKKVIGICTNIKKINMDGVLLNTLQLASPSKLEEFSIRTNAKTFSINLDNFIELKSFSLELPHD